MCRFCDHVKNEIERLNTRLETMACQDTKKRPLKHPHRKEYWQQQYQNERERRKTAALARYYARKEIQQ